MELSTVLQNAEEARKGLMNFDLRAHPTIEGINSCFRICERAIEVLAPAIAVVDELNVLYECNLGLHPKTVEEGKSIRAALVKCMKFFECNVIIVMALNKYIKGFLLTDNQYITHLK